MLRSRRNPWDSRWPPYSSAVGKYQGSSDVASTSRSDSAEVSASQSFATQPAPPSSATKRPPGLSTFHTLAITSWGSLIQMQRGVAEDGVEVAVDIQVRRVTDSGIKPAFEGSPNLFGATVNRNDFTPGSEEPFGQRPIAASKIEYTLTGLRVE